MFAIRRTSLALFLLGSAGFLHAQSDVQIDSQDGMLSVQADNVSAGELAEELSEALGISVVVTGDTESRVNLDIVDEPLEKALGKLSPNHMLVRNSDATEITEVVLMMSEGQNGSGNAGPNEFLPSGSPADEIINEQAVESPPQSSDAEVLRDPDRAAQARAAASAASNGADIPPDQLPTMYNNDGLALDPDTGLPYEQ